jgi:hypothetical protein
MKPSNERKALKSLSQMLEAIQVPCRMYSGKTTDEIEQSKMIEAMLDLFICELDDEEIIKMAREMSAE